MKAYFRTVLQVKCPACGRADGHWCRDERGKCLNLPHAERRRAALGLATAHMQPLAMAAKAGGQ